jgi:uncharacterized membrane protein
MDGGPRRTYGIERLNGLTDGLFAIVLTLLVIDLGLPEPPRPGEEVADELADNLPDFIGWVISFVVIARVWAIHHLVTASMKRVHGGTLLINFVLLALISLTPFTSSLIGAYEFHVPLATAVFTAQLGLVCLAVGLLARHAHLDPAVRADDAADLRWHWRHHALLVPAVAAAGVGLSFVEPHLVLVLWGGEFALVVVLALRRQGTPGIPDPGA